MVDAETREPVSVRDVAVGAGGGADGAMRCRLERAAAMRAAGLDGESDETGVGAAVEMTCARLIPANLRFGKAICGV